MADFIQKLLGYFGFCNEVNENDTIEKYGNGFKSEVPVLREKLYAQGPVVWQCFSEDGGVQGFRWYSERLRVDEDGDIAEEFLDEVLIEMKASDDLRVPDRFQTNMNTKPVIFRSTTRIINGSLQYSVEYGGELWWA